jgi:hypothetical protein
VIGVNLTRTAESFFLVLLEIIQGLALGDVVEVTSGGQRIVFFVQFSVLRIRDVYPGSRFRMFSPYFFHPGSASYNLSILT